VRGVVLAAARLGWAAHALNLEGTLRPTPRFLQAGCTSCRRTNTVRISKGNRNVAVITKRATAWGKMDAKLDQF